jgi:hypothetical protein
MKKVVNKMINIIEIPVDINNELCYNGIRYRVSPNLKQYEVKNYPIKTNDKYNEWTNECEMDSVIVIDKGDTIKFLDQNGQDITFDIKQV